MALVPLIPQLCENQLCVSGPHGGRKHLTAQPINYETCSECIPLVHFCRACIRLHWSENRHPPLGLQTDGNQHADTDTLPLLTHRLRLPLCCPFPHRKSPGKKRQAINLLGRPVPEMVFSAWFQPETIARVPAQIEQWNQLPEVPPADLLPYPAWMRMGGTDIPRVCIDSEVVEIVWAMRSFRTPYEEIKELKHIGPLHLKLKVLALMNWGVFLLFPLLVVIFPQHHSEALTIPFLISLTVFNLGMKSWISRQALPCMISVCGAPTVFGFKPNFRIYSVFLAILSVISTLDLVTNTVFVVQQLESDNMPHRVLGLIEFMSCLKMAWMVMLLQPLFGLAYSFPLASTWDSNAQHFFPFGYGMTPAAQQSAVYQTHAESTQTHQGAVFALAAVTRTQVLLWQQASYLKKCHFGRSSGSVAMKALKQQICRSVVFVTLEAVVFLGLKVLVVQNQGTKDEVALVSALTGLISVTKTLVQDFNTINSLKSDVERGHDHFASLEQHNQAEADERQRILNNFPGEETVTVSADVWVKTWKMLALLPAVVVIVASAVNLWRAV